MADICLTSISTLYQEYILDYNEADLYANKHIALVMSGKYDMFFLSGISGQVLRALKRFYCNKTQEHQEIF
jgi:hypothetical protein